MKRQTDMPKMVETVSNQSENEVTYLKKKKESNLSHLYWAEGAPKTTVSQNLRTSYNYIADYF